MKMQQEGLFAAVDQINEELADWATLAIYVEK